MNLLVIGANGLLGSNVVKAAQEREWTVSGTYHTNRPSFDVPLYELDITDIDDVRDVLSTVGPDWVINCAAMTDVDGCEEAPERAYDVNARAPGNLAKLCAGRSIRFLHVSTDYVFNGSERGTYKEDTPADPIQEYGASKLAGERAVTEVNSKALITRLSFVYGVHQSTGELTGFPAWVRGRLTDTEQTPLFTDQYITPTRAGQAAETFGEFIAADESGMFHVAARSCVTPHEFGAEIGRRLGVDNSLLTEGSQDDVDRAAERPLHTCLDVTRLEEVLERAQPTLEEDIDAIADAFEACAVE